MEWNRKWNGWEFLVWNMEDAKMEWNGRFQDWNGKQSSIAQYQLHSKFMEKHIRLSGSNK